MHSVFVYGTLKPGEAAYAQYCQPVITQTQPALMQGQLFHLPQGYPAMTSGDRWITGALLTFRQPETLALIDQFEDYDPQLTEAENLYQRRQRPVFSVTRQPLGTAWVYIMSLSRVRELGGCLVTNDVWSRQQWPSITADESSL
ncbi:MAG: gamma-glutamylcyclotransferase family protein [Cyanobacteria bacterium P01_C01_bin.120]